MTDLPAPPPEALHLPFEKGPFRMAMGLIACPERDWIEIDARYAEEVAFRRVLLAQRHQDVFSALPVSDEARRETLAILAAHLVFRFPEWFARDGTMLRNRLSGESWSLDNPGCDALELAGRVVQEDFCLIQPGADGPTLTAAVLCFPSRWRLAEKIGKPLAIVHAPVPFYAKGLARPVDRFMALLKPGHIALRFNWSVLDSPALFQLTRRPRPAADPPVTAENAGESLFLRVERQTLRQLPQSGAVLFGIRVHVYPLAQAARQATMAARLAQAVRALPAEMVAYKAMDGFRDALLAWLDQRLTCSRA